MEASFPFVVDGLVGVVEREPHGPAGTADEASLGLSIRHTWPQLPTPQSPHERVRAGAHPGEFIVTIAKGGNSVRVTEVGRRRPMPRGGVRGKIQGFSKAAQLNMLDLIHRIDRSRVLRSDFMTLTVPRGEADWQIIERHRRAWVKRFERQYPGQAVIFWKKEPHRSGTVHLHALVVWVVGDVPALQVLREWNDDAWADVVKSKNPHHRRVGCRVEVMNSWNGVGSYSAKYLAKPQDGLREDTGKIWGVHNRRLLPVKLDLQHVPRAAGVRLRRVLRKLQSRRREKWWHRLDGRWVPIRQVQGGLSVSDQLALARLCGVRVKRTRPRCMATRWQTVWGQVEGTAKVQPIGEEIQTYASALHFVRADTTDALLMWAMGRWLDEVEDVEIPV